MFDIHVESTIYTVSHHIAWHNLRRQNHIFNRKIETTEIISCAKWLPQQQKLSALTQVVLAHLQAYIGFLLDSMTFCWTYNILMNKRRD